MSGDPLRLDEYHEWSGVWWLPDHPDVRVPGTLRYNSNYDLLLSLNGGFENLVIQQPVNGVIHFDGQRTSFKVIHGISDGQPITLFDCDEMHADFSLKTFPLHPLQQTISASTALVGSHIFKKNAAVFIGFEFSIENLELWAAATVKSISDAQPDGLASEKMPLTCLSTATNNLDPSVFNLCRREVPVTSNLHNSKDPESHEATFIQVRQVAPCSLLGTQKIVQQLQDLVSLATNQAAGLLWLSLMSDSELDASRPMAQTVESIGVIYSPAKVGKKSLDPLPLYRFLFTCMDLPFETIIPRWFQINQRLRSPINMLLALFYAPQHYIEADLVLTVAAAEVLHQRLYSPATSVAATNCSTNNNKLSNCSSNRSKLYNKNCSSRNPTLATRLKELATFLNDDVHRLSLPDFESWAKRTAQARNNLIHTGQTQNHSFKELVAIVATTKAIIILIILDQVGLPAERQVEIIQTHPWFRYVVKSARTRLKDKKL